MRTARQMGLVACQRCTRVWPGGTARCARCGHGMQSRDPLSLQKVWALWLVGMICYIPANIYPMLSTHTLVSDYQSTVVGGALELGQHGEWPVALVILVASVAIPITKFIVIAALAFGVRNKSRLSPERRQLLHELVEYIGRWSMIDVFVVAILSSLVHLGSIASIAPGIASLFFALSVVFTMLSAQAFDSRLIWDARSGTLPPEMAPHVRITPKIAPRIPPQLARAGRALPTSANIGRRPSRRRRPPDLPGDPSS
ncbi:hypothetical protein PSAL_024890 [Pseudooceanicola algae]|uniref:Uncharacterized protein n=1 Tax=Pseudooceanicola algae TaxID=1537215 RepID=A0A418SAU1_9RHOB|nr:hypothetical protein PSAL_024890 [Pseudooceanicola algae]